MQFTQTFTITCGDQAENHAGMQKIGVLAKEGFSCEELASIEKLFSAKGVVCQMCNLSLYAGESVSEAKILIIRHGLDLILSEIGKTANDMFIEQANLEHDKKAKMYGRVVNKHARHNLCFDAIGQEPDYEKGMGRIVSFNDVPITNFVRNKLKFYFGDKADDLKMEGNYYFDIKKCGIGFHGDAERKKVIGIRLGATLPLDYHWFKNSKPIGGSLRIILEHGDMYVMSEKAVGTDWKSKKIATLRHAAGCEKYLSVKSK